MAIVRILAVTKNQTLASRLRERVSDFRYELVLAKTSGGALRRLGDERFALALLHVQSAQPLAAILTAVKRRDPETRIMVLSAQAEVRDRIAALDDGADDYLVEPVDVSELAARIRALLRRVFSDSQQLSLGDLNVDVYKRTAKRGPCSIELTKIEFELLTFLLMNKERLIPRQTLLSQLWGHLQPGDRLNNLLDVHMSSLRRKIQGNSQYKLIHTIKGEGFRLASNEAE